MKIFNLIILIGISFLNSCEKTYEENEGISFKTKKNRIIGKWKLIKMENIKQLSPEKEQILELTEDKIGKNIFRAKFINFQEEYCWYNQDSIGHNLFNSIGTWEFAGNEFANSCSQFEELKDKEGIILYLIIEKHKLIRRKWKILKLTSNELKLKTTICINNPCAYYTKSRVLEFLKI